MHAQICIHKIIGQLLAICSHYSEFKSLVILVVKINLISVIKESSGFDING